MAGSGWSACAARLACRACSARCAGPARMPSQTCSPTCRALSRSALPLASRMSTTAPLSADSRRVGDSEPLTLQMLLQAGHKLDEVAGTETIVELMDQNAVPGVAAGAGRAPQCQQIGASRQPRRRPALERRRADLL